MYGIWVGKVRNEWVVSLPLFLSVVVISVIVFGFLSGLRNSPLTCLFDVVWVVFSRCAVTLLTWDLCTSSHSPRIWHYTPSFSGLSNVRSFMEKYFVFLFILFNIYVSSLSKSTLFGYDFFFRSLTITYSVLSLLKRTFRYIQFIIPTNNEIFLLFLF